MYTKSGLCSSAGIEGRKPVEFPSGLYEFHGGSKCEGHTMGQAVHHYLIFQTAGGFCGIAWRASHASSCLDQAKSALLSGKQLWVIANGSPFRSNLLTVLILS